MRQVSDFSFSIAERGPRQSLACPCSAKQGRSLRIKVKIKIKIQTDKEIIQNNRMQTCGDNLFQSLLIIVLVISPIRTIFLIRQFDETFWRVNDFSIIVCISSQATTNANEQQIYSNIQFVAVEEERMRQILSSKRVTTKQILRINTDKIVPTGTKVIKIKKIKNKKIKINKQNKEKNKTKQKRQNKNKQNKQTNKKLN
jgi:hypothetical protein